MSTPSPSPRKKKAVRKVTPEYLERVALWYMDRYAGSAASLERVLTLRVRRSVRAHDTDPAEATAWVRTIIEKHRAKGILDDARFAQNRAENLHRRGTSLRMIRHRLAAKGIDPDTVRQVLDRMTEELPETEENPDLVAAIAFARRRRLGPFRPADQRQEKAQKDLAALGRAGFSGDIARKVILAKDTSDLIM
ncbi:MAG: RecX family transcriptional regulator [Pseudomonadota bacterium]|nr:RecX family transcriptional regulator [Pseudomonadota bacterium]